MIWHRLSPPRRYQWLAFRDHVRARAVFYLGVAFWTGAPGYILWGMFFRGGL